MVRKYNRRRLVQGLTAAYRSYWFNASPSRLVHRQEVRAFFREHLVVSKALEIGGGTGKMIPVLQMACRPGYLVCSDIDPSEATNLVCDTFALPFPDGVFDVVAAFEVLEHLREPGAFACEVGRVLRSGGYVVLSVPFLLGIHDHRDYFRFTDQGLTELLRGQGLEVVRLRKIGGICLSILSLLTEFFRTRALGPSEGWRSRSFPRRANFALTTAVTMPLVGVSWIAMLLDALVDADSKSPAGFIVVARRVEIRTQ